MLSLQQFMRFSACICVTLSIAGAIYSNPANATEEPASARFSLINNQGKIVGTATIREATHGILLNISTRELSPGKHGMHFHHIGTCEDIEEFKATGGHIDPHHKPHGFLNPDGPHEGNLPNLIVDNTGNAEVELYSTLVALDKPSNANDTRPYLRDEDGSTLIIHASEDDHFTQPIGGAGARVACGVVK